MKKHTVTVENLKWFYRETLPKSDRNQTIVFLHGIPSTGHSWHKLMEPMTTAGYRCIAPDWIGYGASEQPDRRDFKYTPEAYQAALGAFLDALELESVILVVQGYIGSSGVLYALANPERVDRLVILNTPLVSKAKLPWIMQQWGIPFVGDMLTQDPLLIDRTLEKGSGFVISEEDLTFYRRPFLKSSSAGRSLVASIKNLQLSQVTKTIETELPNWGKPVHLLWGIADPWLDSTPVSVLAQPHDNMTWHPFPEAKHYAQEHWSKEISPVLIEQLND